MWVDESGGTDATDTAGTPGEMTVTVDGQEYTAEVNFDIDDDGHGDTTRIENTDGTVTAYTDLDGDGHADQYLHVDAQGNVLESARFDPASGEWVSAEPSDSTTDSDSQTSSSGGMTADMPDGDVSLGPATIDTDRDGTNDTAVVEDDKGNTRMFTDVDGDGKADVQTIITPTGESTTYDHTGDGQWTEVPNGLMSESAQPPSSNQVWGSGHDTVEGVAKIDSATGQWISRN